jgi:tetratricopeptide (TPR) repeat protein
MPVEALAMKQLVTISLGVCIAFAWSGSDDVRADDPAPDQSAVRDALRGVLNETLKRVDEIPADVRPSALKDLAEAFRLLGEQDSAREAVQQCFKLATALPERPSLFDAELAAIAAKAGDHETEREAFRNAVKDIEAIPDRDSPTKCASMTGFADLLAKTGHRDEAVQTLRRAVDLTEMITESDSAFNYLGRIAASQAKYQDRDGTARTFDRARHRLWAIPAQDEQKFNLSEFLRAALEQPGSVPAVIALLNQDADLADDWLWHFLIRDIAKWKTADQAAAKDLLNVIRAKVALADRFDTLSALFEIAQTQADLGLASESRETVEAMMRVIEKQPEVRAEGLAWAGIALAYAGARSGARKYLDDAFDAANPANGEPLGFTLSQVALGRAALGDREGALRTIEAMGPEGDPGECSTRMEAWIELARLDFKEHRDREADKDLNHAAALYRAAPEDSGAKRLWERIAECQADAGEVDAAIETINELPDGFRQIMDLDDVADRLARNHRRDALLRLRDALPEVVKKAVAKDPSKQSLIEFVGVKLVEKLAKELARAGGGKEALGSAVQTEPLSMRCQLLRSISEGLAPDEQQDRPAQGKP